MFFRPIVSLVSSIVMSAICSAGCLYNGVEYGTGVVLKQVTAYMQCDGQEKQSAHWVKAPSDFARKRGCWFRDGYFLENSTFLIDGKEKYCHVSAKNDFSWRDK